MISILPTTSITEEVLHLAEICESGSSSEYHPTGSEIRILDQSFSANGGALIISEAELDTWLGWLEKPKPEELARYDVFEVHTA